MHDQIRGAFSLARERNVRPSSGAMTYDGDNHLVRRRIEDSRNAVPSTARRPAAWLHTAQRYQVIGYRVAARPHSGPVLVQAGEDRHWKDGQPSRNKGDIGGISGPCSADQ